MTLARYSPVIMLVVLLIAPFALRGNEPEPPADAAVLIIMTPHNEQIRAEFARAFAAWHEETYGSAARVVWSTPGGTSEIRKLLISEYTAALENNLPLGGNADLMWGGGSYEFGVLAQPVKGVVDGEERSATILEPLDFTSEELQAIYGDGEIAGDPLYNAEGYWYGTALSSFGIVYNRDVLKELDEPEPTTWEHLGAPGLFGTITLANPGMSGSVTTAFEALLERRGWVDGWCVLRRMAANARSFPGSSTKGPLEVADGSAAAAVCIDFYGRYEAQRTHAAALRSGAARDSIGRIGYADPPGETKIDPDPIGLLRGAPSPELARRFVAFVLSEAGQSLWQFPVAAEGPGPRKFELRRLPIRRSMYGAPFSQFVDKVDPWIIARPVENPNRAMRAFIAPLFQAMALDQPRKLAAAWRAIVEHPGYPVDAQGIVKAADVTDPSLAAMLEQFDALPTIAGPQDAIFRLDDPSSLADIKAGMLRGGWKDAGLWSKEANPTQVFRRNAREFFRSNYKAIELAHEAEIDG